jgi:D-alanyl-D-alanine carboxypeptidase
MLELTRKISLPRLPGLRAWVPLLATVIVAVVAAALLTAGGHGGTRPSVPMPAAHAATQPSPPGPIARSAHSKSTCAHGSGSAGTGVSSAVPARQSALGRELDGALRAARTSVDAPAVTAAVVECGRVVWAGATGVLDLGSRRPATNQSLFILNSAAKTFVATMVMQEIQAGHLSLGTRLSQFYPWLPNASQITVRMLLNMTSGLPDYLYNPRIDAVMDRQPRHHWTVDQILTGLGTGLGTPKFLPGRGFAYSDTNYIVLGAILQRITHTSIERDLQQLIARPLGITSATFVPTPAAKALMAHPYLLKRSGVLSDQWIPGFGLSTAVWGPVFTDGGLASSSLDLARFANALVGGRLVDAAAVAQMSRIGTGDYGYGMRGRSFGGRYWVGHRGYFGGFEAEDWSDASRQLTIAVATNLQVVGGAPISTSIWTDIARAYDRYS